MPFIYSHPASLFVPTLMEISVLGIADVDVTYESQNTTLPLVVVKVKAQAGLFDRNWLQHIRLNWSTSLSSHLFKASIPVCFMRN